MKTSRVIAFFLAVAGIIVWQTSRRPIFAAANSSGDTTPTASAAQNPAKRSPVSGSGAQVYQQHCALCHGEKLQGIPPAFPSLAGVGHRTDAQQIALLIHKGRGRMPAFTDTQLSSGDLTSLLHYFATDRTFMTVPAGASATAGQSLATTVDPGGSLYQQDCAFCHGRDAGGGETGPDLTRSKLVADDVKGDKISVVVRNGKPDNKMPKFTLSDAEMADLVRWIHAAAKAAASRPGGRRGVDVADLQTGNVAAGKQYFEGPGKCASCHSPTGDLAGVASRYQGLQLEEQMLYPKDAKDKLTVVLPNGETVVGVLEYQDEFTVGMRDSTGTYRSWPVKGTKFTIDSPVTAHVDLFPKYTDDDIHNLMAYIQTLK